MKVTKLSLFLLLVTQIYKVYFNQLNQEKQEAICLKIFTAVKAVVEN